MSNLWVLNGSTNVFILGKSYGRRKRRRKRRSPFYQFKIQLNLLYAVEWSMNWEIDFCQNQSICSVTLFLFCNVSARYLKDKHSIYKYLSIFFNVQHVFIIFSHGKKKSLRGLNVWQISQPWRKKLNSAKRYYIDINNNISSITKDCDAVNMNKSNIGMGFFLFFFSPLQTALRNTFRLLLHMWNLLTRSLQRPAITR